MIVEIHKLDGGKRALASVTKSIKTGIDGAMPSMLHRPSSRTRAFVQPRKIAYVA